MQKLDDILRPKVIMVRTRPTIRRNHNAPKDRSPSRYAKAFAMKRKKRKGKKLFSRAGCRTASNTILVRIKTTERKRTVSPSLERFYTKLKMWASGWGGGGGSFIKGTTPKKRG